MKSEQEIIKYLENCKKQLIDEEKSKHFYLAHTAKIVISTLLWVLDYDYSIDLNNIEKE